MQKPEGQKRQFVVPKKEELIEQIKNLSDEIENVSLNLIKCDFNAVQKDVEKAFPEFTFLKVKKYNPGSFEIVFETRIDAINFIRNSHDRKILARRFFIKMGRQHKEIAENWAAVGYVPIQFKQPIRKGRLPQKDEKEEEKIEEVTEVKHTEAVKSQEKEVVVVKEIAVEHKVIPKVEAKPEQAKKEFKVVEKVEKVKEQKVVPKQEVKIEVKPVEKAKPVEPKPIEVKPIEVKAVAKPIEVKAEIKKPVQVKIAQKTVEPKQVEAKKEEKKEVKEVKQVKEVKKEEKKEEEVDDWIVIPTSKRGRRR